MQPAPANAPSSRPRTRTGSRTLLSQYLSALTARGAGNSSYESAARTFLARWPYPQGWANQPLRLRLSANAATRVLLNYLMLAGHLRPGYDYLLERKLPALLREASASPHGRDLDRFLAAAAELGYRQGVAAGMASQVLMRLFIQTGKAMAELTAADLDEFDAAISCREKARGKSLKHYHTALYATGTVLYHLGAAVNPTKKRSKHLRWDWPRHFAGANEHVAASLVSYLKCAAATRTRSTMLHIAGRLAHFARFLADLDPTLCSLAGLNRQRHIEPYRCRSRSGESVSRRSAG